MVVYPTVSQDVHRAGYAGAAIAAGQRFSLGPAAGPGTHGGARSGSGPVHIRCGSGSGRRHVRDRGRAWLVPAQQPERDQREDQHREQAGADQRGGGHRAELAQRHPDLGGGDDERQRGRLQQPEGQRRPGAGGAQAEQRGQAAHGQQREQEQRDPDQRGRAVQQSGQVEPDPAARRRTPAPGSRSRSRRAWCGSSGARRSRGRPGRRWPRPGRRPGWFRGRTARPAR